MYKLLINYQFYNLLCLIKRNNSVREKIMNSIKKEAALLKQTVGTMMGTG